MDPMIWQVIAVAAIALVIIGVVAWIIARRRRGVGVGTHTHDLQSRYSELQTEMASLRDRHGLLDERVERFERANTESHDRIATFREDFESRLARYDALDQRMREIQEQIYEIRQEHKVLMERDERHERRVNELQEQLSEVRSEVHTTHGDGNGRRVRT